MAPIVAPSERNYVRFRSGRAEVALERLGFEGPRTLWAIHVRMDGKVLVNRDRIAVDSTRSSAAVAEEVLLALLDSDENDRAQNDWHLDPWALCAAVETIAGDASAARQAGHFGDVRLDLREL